MSGNDKLCISNLFKLKKRVNYQLLCNKAHIDWTDIEEAEEIDQIAETMEKMEITTILLNQCKNTLITRRERR